MRAIQGQRPDLVIFLSCPLIDFTRIIVPEALLTHFHGKAVIETQEHFWRIQRTTSQPDKRLQNDDNDKGKMVTYERVNTRF